MHRKKGDQYVGHEKFGKRDGAEGDHGNDLVEQGVAVKGGQNSQYDGDGNGDHGGHGSQKEGVGEPPADQFGDGPAIGQGVAQIALQKTAQPGKVAHMGGQIQLEFLAKSRHGFRCRLLPQDGFGQVAGQGFDADKDQYGNDDDGDQDQGRVV